MTFEITSGFVHVTDPCYEVETWCGNYNLPARNGTWRAEVSLDDDEGPVASFVTIHEDYQGKNLTWKYLENEVGVDSGQAGIFDASIYEPKTPYGDEEKFYGRCCAATLSEKHCGVVFNKGFVSNSGFGDGGYDGYGAYDFAGNLIAVKVVFID